MKTRSFFAIFFVLVVLLIAAGCSQPAPTPVATPTPTPVPTTVMTTAPTPVPTTVPETPGPTQTLPAIWSIQVSVGNNGEAIDPQIIVTISGGQGINLVPEIEADVTRSDGVVETGTLQQPISMGQTITLNGTTQNKDRCVVYVYQPTGEKIKIYDAYVPFRQFH